MTLRDTIRMSLHNLWYRKYRTLLNLVGIVTACTLLLITFAGTRGVANGIHSILNGAEAFRTIIVSQLTGGVRPQPPFQSTDVTGQMSSARRERVFELIKHRWGWLPYRLVTPKQQKPILPVDEVASSIESQHKHVIEALPVSQQSCRFELSEDAPPNPPLHPEIVRAARDPNLVNSVSVSLVGDTMRDRVIAGGMLQAEDRNGVLIHETAAFLLGYQSDDDLEQLIGRSGQIFYHNFEYRNDFAARAVQTVASRVKLQERAELTTAMDDLLESVDQTDLTERQKKLLRDATKPKDTPKGIDVALTTPPRSAEDASTQYESGNTSDAGKPVTETGGVEKPDVIVLDATIIGVIKDSRPTGLLESFNRLSRQSASLYIHPELAKEYRRQVRYPNNEARISVKVDDVENLRTTVEQLSATGYHTSSAENVVRSAIYRIEQVREANSWLAALILAITSMIVFNGMVVSVMERTREFGVMKATGATNGNVLRLMLCEGAMTGILGSAIAVAVALGLSRFMDATVRSQVEAHIRQSFEERVFEFTTIDIATVTGVAILVCTIASAIPAYRAARLDPVIAMQAK
ncbi:FtsX-like permease family protein [bacterium]|nr:FtsX-like permease family protein [bacterium]